MHQSKRIKRERHQGDFNLGNKATFKLTHVDSGRQNQDSLGELYSAPPPTSILEYHEWEFIPRKSLTILSYPVFF